MAKKKALNSRSRREKPPQKRRNVVLAPPRGLDAAEGDEDTVDEAIRHGEEARVTRERDRQERTRKKAA